MAGKLKEKEFHIEFPSHAYKVILVVSKDVVASRRKRNKILGKLSKNYDATGIFSNDNQYEGYIFLSYNTRIDIIAHECFHAITHMLTSIDTKLNKHTEECFAYPLGYLVEEVYKLTRRKLKQDK